MKYYLFLTLTVAAIISQLPHVWYTFLSFSRLKGWIRDTQSIMFCGILSIAIFAFVWIGKPKLALIGVCIEIIVNLYYYSLDFWKDGYKAFSGKDKVISKKRRDSRRRFWRKNWIAIFFAILIPMLIYIFSEQMREIVANQNIE